MLNIGFAKLGLKTYFDKKNNNRSNQGSAHELPDVFNIFKERGHNCVMLTFNDKYEVVGTDGLDFIFIFNGFLPNTLETNMMMLKQPIEVYKLLNNCDIPWVYFQTDSRYSIKEISVVRQPNLILSQEKENYGHLEKLILYGKYKQVNTLKSNKLGILINDTEPKRSKLVLDALNWLNYGEIRGKWKKQNKFLKEPLKEDDVDNYLSTLKYSYNLATNPKWVSQKYYEMILNNVICFYKNYDEDGLIIPKDDFRRVRDGIDIEEKIDIIEKNENAYELMLKAQQEELKEEYFNGDFIYDFIIKKII